MKRFLEFMKLAFSEKGVPSAKRVLAGYLILILGVCIAYIVFSNPFNETVKELINFNSVCACSLAGVAVVTAFAGKKGGK